MENFDLLLEETETLLAEKRFATLRQNLSAMNAADIAELYDEISEKYRPVIYRLLPKELAAEVFVEMDTDHRESLILLFSDKELREMVSELYVDDTADIIEEMPASVVERILRAADAETRKTLNDLLRYPRDSAGSVMTTEFVLLKETQTVQEAFETIRRVAIDKETIYTCYVTDRNRKLIGILSAKDLLISDPDRLVGTIMNRNVISVETLTDKEEVARMFEKYDFLAMPVVDTENRLVGIVTVDDAMDVLHEEVEEDFAVMAAVTPTEEPYLKTSVIKTFFTRIPWLVLLMISATFTGAIIAGFESALSVCVILTAFIPMLMGTGGNSASQASVMIIRGLSLGEIEFRDIGRVILKELGVAFLCGTVLGAVSFGKVLLIDYLLMGVITPAEQPLLVAAVVGITCAATVITAKLIGALLPILADKIGFDPAVMASPLITTIVDTISLLIYFVVASALLIPVLT